MEESTKPHLFLVFILVDTQLLVQYLELFGFDLALRNVPRR